MKMDDDTAALYKFNEDLVSDSRVRTVLLPVRDGMMILEKL